MKLDLKGGLFAVGLLLAAGVAAVLFLIVAFVFIVTAAGNVSILALPILYVTGLIDIIPTTPGGQIIFMFVPLGILIACFYLWEKQTSTFLEFIGVALGMLAMMMIPIGLPGVFLYVALKNSLWPDLPKWTFIPLGFFGYFALLRILVFFDKKPPA